MEKKKCRVCTAESNVSNPVFPTGEGNICLKCLKKQKKIVLTYRMHFPERKKPLADRKVEIVARGDTYGHKEALKNSGFAYIDGVWTAYTKPASAIELHAALAQKLGALDGYRTDQDEHFSDEEILPQDATNSLVEIFGNAFK